ncbi:MULTISPECIES: sel1 repeat family protein [unclassified Pseudomonas]|uniref:SEL1-like repeat protein n=1 Tax=unclassified Pseudomonas TaxID=196821 RepID=UPI000C88D397|nr:MULTISPECIES: sel1 repeat family protein [unclassified Pseudomonas]PMZ85112.1 sel1 repeat family protein [Pseudomonas sp. FW215-T2]PNA06270.1 sel1 repeat family protein [Pseudomonas sp. FW215-R3]PNB33057.1 sel1 repeat family protein [Pseudomonas sp. FW305-131]
MRPVLLLACLLLVACDTSNPTSTSTKETPLNPLSEVKSKLAFSCVHEQIPAASAEADVLFHYARWLQKNNQLKQDKTVDTEIERLYRIASENGHYKANINLQNGAMRGTFKLRGEEHLRMSEQLINAGVATGYYFVGIFLQNGSAGLEKDHEMALRYYRKAADQGNAQAQAYIADKLAPIDVAPDVARQLRRCAAEQGNGEAAVDLGIHLKNKGQYKEALEIFQMGVAAGNESAAAWLNDGFRGPEPTDKLDYLGQLEDLERADRYEKIWKILSGYSYANPKVPEINEIVPLPPATLPAWDGKLQWLEERLANVPPEKPSEALINQLAKAKVLEPATGRPMPGSPAFIQIDNIKRPTCNSGQACTHTGYWLAESIAGQSWSRLEKGEPRRFEKGEIMPTLNVQHRQSRFLLADRFTVEEEKIEWSLLGEA